MYPRGDVRLLCFLIAIGASAVAAADPAAEKLFQDGRTALAAGKLDEACDAFSRSELLEPRVGTLLNLADCNEKRGKTATAWNQFVDAFNRATLANDPRGAEAAKRRDALAPRLPYLKIVVPPGVRALSPRMTRDGVVVDAVTWDVDLPIDPGTHRFAVDAPGYAQWQKDVTVADGKHEVLTVDALVADPNAKPAESPPHDDHPVAIPNAPHAYHIGIGGLTGLSSDKDWINGARLVLNAAPVGPGVVRVVPQFLYASGPNPSDQYQEFTTYAFGLGFEYAYAATDRIVAAAGLGLGMDLFYDSYQNGAAKNFWGALRLSPTFRFDRFDAGAHVQIVRTSDRVVVLAELGLDVFVW